MMFGTRFPILVFKSPHSTVVSCGCIPSSISSIASVAFSSGIFFLVSDAVGGRYILIIFTRSLLGKIIFVYIPYSLLLTYSIFRPFFMYVAMPPLVPFCLRYSIILYPSKFGVIVSPVSHVSWRHIMSKSCYCSNRYILK